MLMISAEEIRAQTDTAESLINKLQKLYEALPETQCPCERPGQCCIFLPQMTWIEALQWFRHLRALPPGEKENLVRDFLLFFLTNPVRPGHCPFLTDGGSCGIYEFRPFACRAYGMWSHSYGRQQTEQSREGKKALVAMWRRYGIELPEDVAVHEIDYCDKMIVREHKSITDARLMEILSEVYQLDDAQPDLQKRFEDGYQSDFSALMASLVWGSRKANLNKYAVIKDIVQKDSDVRLRKLLARVTVPF